MLLKQYRTGIYSSV
jgi:hypothetical protein